MGPWREGHPHGPRHYAEYGRNGKDPRCVPRPRIQCVAPERRWSERGTISPACSLWVSSARDSAGALIIIPGTPAELLEPDGWPRRRTHEAAA